MADEGKDLIDLMASAVSIKRQDFIDTVKKTCFARGEATNEQLMMFLAVAKEHELNPFTKEIYAFINPKTNQLQAVVGVDGWIKIIQRNPRFDGAEFNVQLDSTGKKPISVTCTLHRKGQNHPTIVTEYYDECYRPTDPWNQMPKRMLRHKALIQCARVAFGFAGIMDEDEAGRLAESWNIDVSREKPAQITQDDMPTAARKVKGEVVGKPAKDRKTAVPEIVKPEASPQDDHPVTVSEADELAQQAESLNLNRRRIKPVLEKFGVEEFEELKVSQLTAVANALAAAAA